MEIKQIIDKFPGWHYQFDLQGHLTPVRRPRSVNRVEERRRYFFDPLVELLGGSLKGKRVLDLGCNAGFWSLAAIEAGCDFVLGIDGRQVHIDQADFVFDVKAVDKGRYRFCTGNIFDLDLRQFGSFDVVLCLGLLYHLGKPLELLETIAEINSDLLVIDTRVCQAPGSHLEIHRDPLDNPLNAVDYELVLFPTKRAVLAMVRQFGYKAVQLKPRFRSYSGAFDYWYGARRAYLCAKRTDVSRAPVVVERVNLPSQAFDAWLWVAWQAGRFVRQRLRAR